MTTDQLIEQLIVNGGAIVSSGDCSEMEIVYARADGRFAAREDGLGFVRRTKEWLNIQLTREKAHPNVDGKYSQPLAEGAGAKMTLIRLKRRLRQFWLLSLISRGDRADNKMFRKYYKERLEKGDKWK